MARTKARDLTLKQAAFAPEYVHCKGNGTKAAKRAGYTDKSAHVAASRALRNDKVVAEINRLTRRHDISAERVLTRLDNLSMDAEAEGEYSAAIKAEELIGKSMGMWIERSSMQVNVDVSIAHLDALRALVSARTRPVVSTHSVTDVDADDA